MSAHPAIEKRPFGRTGHMSTFTIFGAAALGSVSQSDADRTLDLLLEYGINHIYLSGDIRQFIGLGTSFNFTSTIFEGGVVVEF